MESRARPKPAACEHCRQDIVRSCNVCMYAGENGTCLYEPIKKLVVAGARVGLDIDTMIGLLEEGMSITDLVIYIESCRPAS